MQKKLTRHFLISSDLDDLERLEEDLEASGVVFSQIHLLTLDDAEADRHPHLHTVSSLMKKDLVHSGLIGFGVGVGAAILVLLVAELAGWTETPAGRIPFVFLAIILLGFFTWEGGLFGIETPNAHFREFEQALEQGRHVFFVDLEPHQATLMDEVVKRHPSVERAGTGPAAPHWIIRAQYRIKRFFVEVFP